MNDPRRIFSALFAKIGDYLSDDASQGDARAWLLAEARALRAHFRDTVKAYDSALAQSIKILEQSNNQELMAKAPFIREELMVMRRALYRSILTRQDKQTLVTELNEWRQHKHLSKGAESQIRGERMEMLESELRTRLVTKDLPDQDVAVESLISDASQVAERVFADFHIDTPGSTVTTERHLPTIELWKSLQPNTDDVMTSWSLVLKKAHHPTLDYRASADLITSFKHAQAAIKRQDRSSGIVRYRLAAFEEINR